jgi:hypothetical protein
MFLAAFLAVGALPVCLAAQFRLVEGATQVQDLKLGS